MRTAAIIQARMSSSRLPGKSMLEICKKPIIEHIFDRVRSCKLVDELILATSDDQSDDVLFQWAQNNNINCYRGSLDDVLDRFYKAAILYKVDTIVRITGDCPLIDPNTVDEVIKGFNKGNYDLYSLGGSFPDGLDCQVFSFKSALEVAWNNAVLPSEREHVCPYIENNPQLFNLGSLNKFPNSSSIRITLDQKEDFKLIKKIYEHFYHSDTLFDIKSILQFLVNNPELLEINAGIVRNEGYYKSLTQD
jgi:spore coat polysaccharide biosynthesis protein SpsF (cytidylyltransferase family)